MLADPQIEVILTDDDHPTNTSGGVWEAAHPRCLFVHVDDRSARVVHWLNAAITHAWQRVGSPGDVQVATAHDAVHGHEAPRRWCGTAPPEIDETWIQSPTDPDSNATPVGGDGFHANRAGAEHFADAVTGLVPPDLALPVRLHGNDSSLAPGEPLTRTLTIRPESIPVVVDCDVGPQLPDQRLWFLHADGSFTPEIQPYVEEWPVVPFRAELFHDTFTGSEPPGDYQWLAVCTEPGTGTILGATAQAPSTFSP